MKGKYCDYYWSVKKEKEGYAWYIRSSVTKGAEVLQSSKDNDDPEDRYFDNETAARSDAYDAIQDYYR